MLLRLATARNGTPWCGSSACWKAPDHGGLPEWRLCCWRCAGKPGRRRVLRRTGASRASRRASDAAMPDPPLVADPAWWPVRQAAQYAASSGLGSKAGSAPRRGRPQSFRLAVPSSRFRGSASAVDQGRLGMPSRAAGHQGRAPGLSPAHLVGGSTAAEGLPHRSGRFSSLRHRPRCGAPGRPATPAQLHRSPRTSRSTANHTLDGPMQRKHL